MGLATKTIEPLFQLWIKTRVKACLGCKGVPCFADRTLPARQNPPWPMAGAVTLSLQLKMGLPPWLEPKHPGLLEKWVLTCDICTLSLQDEAFCWTYVLQNASRMVHVCWPATIMTCQLMRHKLCRTGHCPPARLSFCRLPSQWIPSDFAWWMESLLAPALGFVLQLCLPAE